MVHEVRQAGNPRTEERFDTGTYTTYYGTALAAVRAGDGGKVVIRINDGEAEAQIKIRQNNG